MSKAIVLLGDLGTDHQGFPPTPVIAGSPTVLVDGKPVARVGDPLVPHSKPKHPPHPRAIAAGSATVMIDGLPAAVTGGAISCGGVTIGSGSVVIGDVHSPVAFSGTSVASQSAKVNTGISSDGSLRSAGPLGLRREDESKVGDGSSMTAIPAQGSVSDAKISKDETSDRLRVGIFFDGTGNHKDNDLKLTDRDITNVAKLHDLYRRTKTIDRIYIPGPGTIEGKATEDGFEASDDLLGLALGVGAQGGHSRIKAAVEQLRLLLQERKPAELEIDVFGFSRGAALARHFVNLVNQWPETLNLPKINSALDFGPVVELENIEAFPANVKRTVKFVGLFDTVGSFYIPGNEQNLDFNLSMNSGSAEKVAHLTAYHEIRKNFPLSSLKSSAGLPANFIEQSVPGVHSDVGGGYENPVKDIRNYETFTVKVFGGHGSNSRTIRNAQIKIEEMNANDERNIQPRVSGMDVIAEERRPTRKELAIVTLHKMYAFARDANVPLVEMNKSLPEYQVPTELQQAILKWRSVGGSLSYSGKYLEGYIHTSHRPGDLAHGPNPKGIRETFLNNPGNAQEARTKTVS